MSEPVARDIAAFAALALPSSSRTDPALRAIFDLAEHLTHGRPIPAESRVLLAAALSEGISSSFEIPFYSALGLKGWGGIPPLRKLGLSRRDRALCRLRRSQPEWAALSPSAAAREMAASARRYETDRWPRERRNPAGPAAQPSATWWSFLRNDVAVPGERQLAAILKKEIQDGFEFHKPSGRVSLEGADDESTTQD